MAQPGGSLVIAIAPFAFAGSALGGAPESVAATLDCDDAGVCAFTYAKTPPPARAATRRPPTTRPTGLFFFSGGMDATAAPAPEPPPVEGTLESVVMSTAGKRPVMP